MQCNGNAMAMQCTAGATLNLGLLYMMGHGVEKNAAMGQRLVALGKELLQQSQADGGAADDALAQQHFGGDHAAAFNAL
jgi:hypothetical protein